MANTEVIFTIEESPEGGYEARALGYSIYTQQIAWKSSRP